MVYSWKPKIDVTKQQIQKEESSWWQDALGTVSKPFEWFGENVEKPIASILTAPFSPETEGTEGMTWLQRQRAEYDKWDAPWGVKFLAEQLPSLAIGGVAGKAVKGLGLGAKALSTASAVSKTAKISKIEESISLLGKEVADTTSKFKQGMRQLVLGSKAQKLGIKAQKGERVIDYAENVKNAQGLDETIKARSAFKGEYSKVGYGSQALDDYVKQLESKISYKGDKYDKTVNQIRKYLDEGHVVPELDAKDFDVLANATNKLLEIDKINQFEHLNITDGLKRLQEFIMGTGSKPYPNQIKAFEEVFGEGFAKFATDLTTNPYTKFLGNAMDWMNLPRSILSSMDISGIFRQGGILFTRHPVIGLKSIAPTIKMLFSEKAAQLSDDIITKMPSFQKGIKSGMELLKSGAGTLGEEAFPSKVVHSIFSKFGLPNPILASERAYVSGLNNFRWKTWDSMVNQMSKLETLGKQVFTDVDYEDLAKLIMVASGRGKLTGVLKDAGGLLNSFFFSPRMIMSRLQLPTMLLSPSRYVRKEAAKTLGSFLGTGLSVLGIAKLAGADVETDARSADFGKIKIGDTRLDIWAGYVQYARFLSQLYTGERKTQGGNETKVERKDILDRFVSSKLSPAMGLFNDLLRGQTIMGEEMSLDPKSLIEQVKNRVAPLFIQDMIEAVSEEGLKGGLLALPSGLGIGVTTYENNVKHIQDKIANEKYNMTWDEVGTKYGDMTQYNLGKGSPELQAALEKQDEDMLGTNWGRWREEGNLIETSFQDVINKASQEFRLTGDGVNFREKVSNAGLVRRNMYDQRNKRTDFSEIVSNMSKPVTEEELQKENPLDIARREYYQLMYADDMTDEFGNYDFAEAERRKELFRQQYGDDKLRYVEEYMGLKFDAPAEYKDLKNAQQILKPYWATIDRVRSMGVDPESKFGQKILARYRNMIKMQNPLIDKYLKLYYYSQ